jgi:hypothetical protein
MCLRATLHRLVDSLPEEDLTTAGRLLIGPDRDRRFFSGRP